MFFFEVSLYFIFMEKRKLEHKELQSVATELRKVLEVITVVAHALRWQNADIDGDAASVLQHNAASNLHECVERIERLLQTGKSL